MIDTAIYGLHKPEDTDSTDLRIFVGQNMDLIESALNNKAPIDSPSFSGNVIFNGTGSLMTFVSPSMTNALYFSFNGKDTEGAELQRGYFGIASGSTPNTLTLASTRGDLELKPKIGFFVNTTSPMKEEGVLLSEKYAPKTGSTDYAPFTHNHAITDITNLESTLNAKYSINGGEITGSVTITNTGDMVELLKFNSDRSWTFKQKGTLSTAELILMSDNNSKTFRVTSPLGVDSLEIRVDNTVGSGFINSPLIKEDGTSLVDKYALKTQIASALNVGMIQVGNGLGMSGNYLFVKTGNGLLIDEAWSVGLDLTYLDTNYVQIEATGGTGTVSQLWTGTQAQYDVLTKDPNTVYYIVG